MAELQVGKTLLLISLNLYILEFFFITCYSTMNELNKTIKISKLKPASMSLLNIPVNTTLMPVIFIFLLTEKAQLPFFLIIIVTVLLFWRLTLTWTPVVLTKSLNDSVIVNFLPMLIVLTLILNYLTSLLSLFFVIELFSVFYFFLFLNSSRSVPLTFLHYKNSLLFLLWNNFLTTVFLSMSCIFLLRELGTLELSEISLLEPVRQYLYLYLIGLSWKIGYPLFHFFKVELYKYLAKENLLLFSVITTIVGFNLLVFVLNQPTMFNCLAKNNLLILSFCVLAQIAACKLKNINFFEFLAISGLLTMSTFTVIYLVRYACTKNNTMFFYWTAVKSAPKIST